MRWQGLQRLAERSGLDFESGIVFCKGNSVISLRDKRLLAVPLPGGDNLRKGTSKSVRGLRYGNPVILFGAVGGHKPVLEVGVDEGGIS